MQEPGPRNKVLGPCLRLAIEQHTHGLALGKTLPISGPLPSLHCSLLRPENLGSIFLALFCLLLATP